MPERRGSLFGTRKQTELLLLLYLLEESFIRELGRLLEISPSTVQSAMDQFEKDGVVSTRKLGVERRVRLNPRFFAAQELRALLARLCEAEPEIERVAEAIRRRPRRRNKPLKSAPESLRP